MDCVKKIGCFPSCNAIKFPYPALETGVHFVVFDWLGTKKTIAFEAVEGEQFYIPNYFNESSDPVFSIKQPSGTYLCWDKELEALAVCPDDCGKDCDFYRHFTLEINQTSGLDGEDIPDYTFSNKLYNIDQAVDNGDGTYTIDVDGAVNGDVAVDDSGTFYEYNDGTWTVKFKEVCAFQDVDTLPVEGEDCALYYQGGKYWAWDGTQYVDVTPTINFGDLENVPDLVESVTGNVVDNTDPKNPIVNIPDQVCSVQSYPTFTNFPAQPEECILYIAEDTKKQYILGPTWVDIASVTYDFHSNFGNLPAIGDPNVVYVTLDTLQGWYWVDGAYEEVEFIQSGTELPKIVEIGGYATLLSTSQLFEGIPDSGYSDVSPLTQNLFTTDLTLEEDRTHLVSHDLLFNLDSNPIGKILFRRYTTSYPQINAEINDRQLSLLVQTSSSPFDTVGILVSSELSIRTGQDLQSLTPTNDFYVLKLVGTTGRVEYHLITADDIDDTTSVQKFVTQGEKDAIGSALQPGDNVSDLTNDVGYLTETTHDALPQDNPHGVTKAQVGLGNVDNTSDADKPVSTAQGLAINQAEANAKQYTDDEISNLNLGSAAQADVGDFATSAQGAKADTAIQPGDNVFELNTQFQTLADAPTISWDVSQGEIAKVVLGGNRTLANPTNLKVGRYDLIIEQDGVGNRSLYLDTNYRMPDGELVLSSDGGSQDKVSFISDGTLMYGAVNQGYRYVPQGFVMTVDTSQTGTSTNTQFTIPTRDGGYNYSVKNANTGVAYLTGQTGNATVDFGSPGVYDIEISGDFPIIYFYNEGDRHKLIEIKQWGNIAWVGFARAFWGCLNLIQVTSADVPNLSGASSISSIFQNCTSLIHVNRIEDWDVSGINNFSIAFQFTQFNQDISGWDVSSADNMFRMLQATPFDQDISNWDIGNLTNADFFMRDTALSTVNYDAILNGWAAQTVQPNLSIDFGTSKYSAAGQVGRDILINTHGWTITDGGPV